MNPAAAAVVIGRNEGERLIRCLASLSGEAHPIVYVDSGSTDGSVEAARASGAVVVELDMSVPFTAARARNAGLAALGTDAPDLVQTVDGDCEMRPGWIATAAGFLAAHPDVAAVAGRLRERHPEATLWNRLADAEWAAEPGAAAAVGGIALWRRGAVDDAGGYREDLIAGEEPELCLRMRRGGWTIWRLADEMAWHDIAMTELSQWWRRMRRGGHAYAEGAALHGRGPERYRIGETRRALLWGAALPLVAGLGALFITPWALLLLLAWPVQILRLTLGGLPLYRAFFLTLGKLPEAQGALGYLLRRGIGRRTGLIEYK